jgi:CRP-like cAMP-binding protein
MTRLTPRSVARPTEVVVRRLRALTLLSEPELDLLRRLGERRERHEPGDELAAEGAPHARARFIVQGWACRQRVLADGRRQIFSFLLPGDGIGLGRGGGPELSAAVALTNLDTVDAEPALEAILAGDAPGLSHGLAAQEAAEQIQLFDHLVRLGRQTAYERVAHLLLELRRRMEAAGLGDSQRFPLPLTQEVLADALGLSIVHVNRTLQQLRRERLIELRGGIAILLEPDLLARIADYRTPPPARRATGDRRGSLQEFPRA